MIGSVKVASKSSIVTSSLVLSMPVIFARIPLNGPPVTSTRSLMSSSSMIDLATTYFSISERETIPGTLDLTCLIPDIASSTTCGPSASEL